MTVRDASESGRLFHAHRPHGTHVWRKRQLMQGLVPSSQVVASPVAEA